MHCLQLDECLGMDYQPGTCYFFLNCKFNNKDIDLTTEKKTLSWPWWRFVMLGLNILALVLSSILSWHYFQNDTIAGCGSGSSCEQVLNSKWSAIAGILPVSGLALSLYLALMVAGFFIGPKTELSIRLLAWKVMLIISGSIAGSAIWFTIIQKWIIGAFCPYCMSLHLVGLILTALIISISMSKTDYKTIKQGRKIKILEPERFFPPLQTIGFVMAGFLLACILAFTQFLYTPTVNYNNVESQGDLYNIDKNNAPVLGSSDAPYIVNVLFDYQCSHCQKIHFMLNEAVNYYNGKLAFVLCPTPLNSECNPYVLQDNDAFKNSCDMAKVGLAVWKAKPEVFADFESWMFTFESGDRWNPRSLKSARKKAIEMVGLENFNSAMADPWISNYLESCVTIYGQTIQNGRGGVPKLIYNSRWIIPEAYDQDEFVTMMQKSLGLPKP